MKIQYIFLVGLIAMSDNVFSQCQSSNLQIQSDACTLPKNLKLSVVRCTEIEVKWEGDRNQTYVVKATTLDIATNRIEDANVLENTCNNLGNCKAVVMAKQGEVMNVSLQAVCQIGKAAFHSAEVSIGHILIPFCEKKEANIPVSVVGRQTVLRVYPNPAAEFLIIEYTGTKTITALRVLDLAGEKLLNRQEISLRPNNQYKLVLQGLPNGTYLLEARTGREVTRTKFVIIRN